MKFIPQKNEGYAALIATILTLVVSLTIIGGLSFFSFQEVNTNRAYVRSIESHYVSEAGVEDAIYRIIAGKQITSGETVGVGNGTTTVTVNTLGNQRIVRSEGKRDKSQQNLETIVEITTTGVNFLYGIHIGGGGLEMSNKSQVIGSVYSNGPIEGENSSTITGDAFAATTSAVTGDLTINGNVQANRIQGGGQIIIGGSASSTTLITKSAVGGNAAADTFTQSAITGNAYYKTSVSADTDVLGSKIQITEPPANLPILPMPISDSQLDQWEQEAAAGGIHGSPCPYILSSGTTNLGPQKITCDMDIKNTAIVNLKGTLWVSGNLTIQNSAIVRLDPLYGATSGLIIVDDPADRSSKSVLDVKNSAQILGSGAPESYVMLVSRNNSAEIGGGTDAIEVQNTSSASIYYAPHGSVEIHNNTNLKEITAYKLEIRNAAAVTYESGLANVSFSAGPGGGYDIKHWKEVE